MNTSTSAMSDAADDAWLRALVQDRAKARWENDSSLSPLPVHLISSPENVEKHWKAILANAHKNGVFAPKNLTRTAIDPLKHASNQSWFTLAASVAVLGIGLSLFIQIEKQEILKPPASLAISGDGPIVMRGDEAPQRLSVPAGESISTRADRIEAVLQRHHLKYRRTPADGSNLQIQAKVPVDSPARSELRALGVELPEHERLNVIVAGGF